MGMIHKKTLVNYLLLVFLITLIIETFLSMLYYFSFKGLGKASSLGTMLAEEQKEMTFALTKAQNKRDTSGRVRWLTPVIPELWETKVDRSRSRDQDHPGQHGESPSLLKNTKISQVWSCVPVVPDNQEAEAGESPEPRRQRLQ